MATKTKRTTERAADPTRFAATVFAVTAATDEEFAAGLPFSDPGAVMEGKPASVKCAVRQKKAAAKKTRK